MTRIVAMFGCSLLLMAAVTLPLHGEALPEIKARLLDDVKYLASDELEGRGPGTNGINLAAKYIKEQFAKSGLAVDRVAGDALQKFELTLGAKLTEPNSIQFLGPNDETIDLKLGEDCEACSFSGTGPFDGEVIFCGYGIEAKDESYDDFAGIDVAGKVIVVLRRAPRQADVKAAHSFASRWICGRR